MASRRELDNQFRIEKVRAWASAIKSGFRFLMVAAICVGGIFIARSLAGKQTFADIRFNALTDFGNNLWLWLGCFVSWLLTFMAIVWAFLERYLRKRHITRVSTEHSELQKMIDPNRRSSHLMENGDTRPGDE
jgi:hypothetical protein